MEFREVASRGNRREEDKQEAGYRGIRSWGGGTVTRKRMSWLLNTR
jgi:hypothetical protein